ncbi:hypothetical protein AAX05_03445 [Moraxella bovoculi]|uniref:antA/AntB antirepressor family protein n=1 Tax=Moraxella bovoculi TaxID=386891 RepID=UPI000624C25F|nr:antA/AntB antirepressor family protein [Moraxella bovoculi]AKG09385.1 hypothetical protein AAX05_03445 [Moraxella bovoculi]AKG13211.1 hypothetical protein AAX11_03195 [Moraxella bovoculi]
MKNLPQIQPHDTLIQAVNARELHHFLQVQTAFKDWIARRISEYGFLEGVDFCSILSESTGGRPAKEYAITLDMAKELSMVERNEQGKQARRYFIECEKRLHAPKELSRLEVLQLTMQTEQENIALRATLDTARPKIAHYDRIVSRGGLINASQIGGKIGLSAVALNRILDEFGVYSKAIKRNGRTFNHWFIERGFGIMKQTNTGHEQALFTHLGEAWVIEKLTNEGVIA